MPARTLENRGHRLNLLDDGDGPTVLYLHGFPDSLNVWRHQLPATRERGFRVVAPDLLGFGASARPPQPEEYGLQSILGDVVAILDELEIERAHVVGHDWGATLGWLLAATRPDRVDRLVAMSVGHPNCFLAAPVEQLQRSWYVLLFQYEGVAEELIRRNDWSLFRAFVREHPEASSWTRDLGRPGALTAALNWYRANISPRHWLEPIDLPKVACDTLGLWSTDDHYLTEANVAESGRYVTGDWSYVRVENASHWLQLDRPEEVNRLVLDFIGG